ncbi:hypothetical protein HYALB_00002100 [Hymenoscyphus albidus]|uniref:Phosphoribosyltransferase domain-containing protein n=1 Tax=Hymenoscyphus albidus TaxID=595503 RepID=A0A9N9LNX4_9HELO|nr:hypothetical protein HYALB_00002100 [Hymenoscyphus albidus]
MSSNDENDAVNVAISKEPYPLEESMAASSEKPVVIGLYGLSGCGKTHFMKRAESYLSSQNFPPLGKEVTFSFYDGSSVISEVTPGGLEAFEQLSDKEKENFRGRAIEDIRTRCAEAKSNTCGVVAGHYLFWDKQEDSEGQRVCTQQDLETYTHIIYLEVPPTIIEKRRREDDKRNRPVVSAQHLEKWQRAEQMQLEQDCRENGILFFTLRYSENDQMFRKGVDLLNEFARHEESFNLQIAKVRLIEIVSNSGPQVETMLALDADRTLSPDDAGTMFWEMLSETTRLRPVNKTCPLKRLFSGPLGYSYAAFRQAALMYEEYTSEEDFDDLCRAVASKISIHPEFLTLLRMVVGNNRIGAVVITSGICRVWEYVLENAGLLNPLRVIGGGRVLENCARGQEHLKDLVVTANVKAELVADLQKTHGLSVWAFGDSPLDLKMLHQADEAIVVVGEEKHRSKSMDFELAKSIDNNSLRAQQVLLPSHALPRLDINKLPLAQLTQDGLFKSILGHPAVRVLHETDSGTAKLLMTPTRNAAVAGVALREAHHRIGMYLGMRYLMKSEVVGHEKYGIPHVQGGEVEGYRLLNEQQTCIVPLMRGGEPMAFGLNDCFPSAMLVHAKEPTDLKPHHLKGQQTVVLVDSVVNTGNSLVQFVKYIRDLCPEMRIIFVAGVVQRQAISSIRKELGAHQRLSIATLRISRNKFTGKGTTDTGNRLFNTTHLD